MAINCTKTQIVHFRRKSTERTTKSFKCGNNKIEVVSKYKYLGCILDEYLDFSITANVLADAAGRAIGSLVNKCIKNNNFKFQTYTKLYDACVVPVMDYASGVWGYNRYDKPNVVQHRAIRSFLGVHRYTSNVAIDGDMGWIWPIVRRKLEMLKLFKRLFNMSESRLTKKILKWDWKHKGRTWSWSIRSILKDTKQANVIIDFNDSNINFTSMLEKAEKELMSIEIKRWEKELEQQPKLRFYRLFKESYETEYYVKTCVSKSSRSFIAQLRSGVLPLKIEVGRFSQKKIEERICDICKSGVEDELHFVFKCPEYQNLRAEFYNHVSRSCNIDDMPDCDKLKYFMKDQNILHKFGTYIRTCFYKRNDSIFNSVS